MCGGSSCSISHCLDIDELPSFARGEQKPADAAERGCRLLISNDREAVALDAFDLQSLAASAAPIGAVPILGDDPLPAPS